MNHVYLSLYFVTTLVTLIDVILLRVLAHDAGSTTFRRMSDLFGCAVGFLVLWLAASYVSVNLLERETAVSILLESGAFVFAYCGEAILAVMVADEYRMSHRAQRSLIVVFLALAAIIVATRVPIHFTGVLLAAARIAKWGAAFLLIAAGTVAAIAFAVRRRRAGVTVPRVIRLVVGAGLPLVLALGLLDLTVLRLRFGAEQAFGMSFPATMAGFLAVTAALLAAVIRELVGLRNPHRSVESLAGHLLTSREREIAALVLEGLSNQAIADRLFVALPTVKNHLHSIYEKLGVKGRAAMIRTFLRPLPGEPAPDADGAE